MYFLSDIIAMIYFCVNYFKSETKSSVSWWLGLNWSSNGYLNMVNYSWWWLRDSLCIRSQQALRMLVRRDIARGGSSLRALYGIWSGPGAVLTLRWGRRAEISRGLINVGVGSGGRSGFKSETKSSVSWSLGLNWSSNGYFNMVNYSWWWLETAAAYVGTGASVALVIEVSRVLFSVAILLTSSSGRLGWFG